MEDTILVKTICFDSCKIHVIQTHVCCFCCKHVVFTLTNTCYYKFNHFNLLFQAPMIFGRSRKFSTNLCPFTYSHHHWIILVLWNRYLVASLLQVVICRAIAQKVYLFIVSMLMQVCANYGLYATYEPQAMVSLLFSPFQ